MSADRKLPAGACGHRAAGRSNSLPDRYAAHLDARPATGACERNAAWTARRSPPLLAQLEAHGMTAIGEHQDIDLAISRKILEGAL